jgi:hypothetical protein
MPPKKRPSKRELENPGDVSVSVAPAASKKAKAQKGTTIGTAPKQATSSVDNGDDLPVMPPPSAEIDAPTTKKRAAPRKKALPSSDQVVEPEEGSSVTSTTKTRTAKATSTLAEEGK